MHTYRQTHFCPYLLNGRGYFSQGQPTLIRTGDTSTANFNNNSLALDEVLTIRNWTMNSLEGILRCI